MMTRKDAASSRNSSASTESWKSSDTIKPASLFRGPSRRGSPMQVKTDSKKKVETDPQVSPTSIAPFLSTASPASNISNVSPRDHRLSSGFGNYRRDLAVLETSGGRIPSIQHNPPTALQGTPNQIAPWMSANGLGAFGALPSPGFGTSFYNDSSDGDNLSQASALSPAFQRPGTSITGNSNSTATDSPSDPYFGDERRPSVASVATASSSGSKSSRGPGIHKKLQTFFGDEFTGKDGSDTSLPSRGKEHREHRSHSFTRGHRERNLSSATEHNPRDSSPAGGSRPRTPVPSSDVVPFLYQDSQDISLYGEAPVREGITGPDRARYVNDSKDPPKTSSSSRSGGVHLPGHNHRHNRSNDDTKPLRPTISREDSAVSVRTKVPVPMGAAMSNASSTSFGQRPASPTPSGLSNWSLGTARTTVNDRERPTSPNGSAKKQTFLGRFRNLKTKDKDFGVSRLKDLPGSVRSFNSPNYGKGDKSPDYGTWSREGSLTGSETALPRIDNGQFGRSPIISNPRQGSKGGIFRMGGRGRDREESEAANPRDHQLNKSQGYEFTLDTNLENMDGILARPAPLTPLDNTIFTGHLEDEQKPEETAAGGKKWDAPDSWAVKKVQDANLSRLAELDETGIPPRFEDKTHLYCIRIFRLDGSYQTLSVPLNTSVEELRLQMAKKSYITDDLDKYKIVMKKHDLQRTLLPSERPLQIQKRLLEQVGFIDIDRIEDIGTQDNSYLCRFSFIQEVQTGAIAEDLSKNKCSHVDLSGKNYVAIPVFYYSKAAEIISLNLSRMLSLDLPGDFIQGCSNLRDIKYNGNEARSLPKSLSEAKRLTILDASNNRLDQLDDAELSKVQGLISLKLANNRLKSLPSYFGSFRSMRTLNLSSNFLETFPVFLCNLEGLVDLDLSFNSIGILPDEIAKLKNLERFVITNNSLKGVLPNSFVELKNLKEVDIRYNQLTSIDVIAKLPKIEQISADHNSVSVCEVEFTRIKVLRLNSNPVTKFEILNPVPTLTSLVLSNAKLAQIPDACFDRMPNLQKLILEKNHFVSLPSHIGKLRKLQIFNIAGNTLSGLPVEIGCLNELIYLDLRQNNLKTLPMEIWWAGKLETLNVSSNMLSSFPKAASRAPQVPGDIQPMSNNTPGLNSGNSSFEELGPLEAFGQQRRPSQVSTGLLSLGSSPVTNGDRKSSLVSVYSGGGKGSHRKTSVVSRSESQTTMGSNTPPMNRKDSGLSSKLINTFAGSLRHLHLADNVLDDDVFQELTKLSELRILNLSYNDLNDMPPGSLKSWPALTELYLSGNELTSLPSDDFEEFSLLQVLHINGNKFQTLPAELGKAHRLAVLDCGSNSLKYNVSNWPYDWNWNWNTNLKFLNLSGNKRLEIKPSAPGGAGARDGRDLTDFSALQHLRVLGLMDVTLTINSVPDQTEDRRVRTSGSLAGQLAYGMADTLGKNEHLSIVDMVVPRFRSKDTETLLGMFDGQELSSGGSKIARHLHENFGLIFSKELQVVDKSTTGETPMDALRRAFLSLNRDLATMISQHTDERPLQVHRGSAAPPVFSQADLRSGAVATIMFLRESELFVANVGDAQAMLITSEGGHRMLTRKHDPAEPNERQRIRDAGGWVSRAGRLNDVLCVSRAFGYVHLMPSVQAAPQISHITVKEQDEMILIASKELWEYLPPQLVVDLARDNRHDLMRAAQRLRDLAIAFGASGKLMVMMIGVSDLKKKAQMRPHRVQSISFNPSQTIEEGYAAPTKRPRKKADFVEDSMLRRLQTEITAPVGDVSIVFTDIKSSTLMWETFPSAMRSAIKLHNEVMRRQLRIIGGYEVKTEGDAFMVSFPTATSALLWTFAVQRELLDVQWPSEVTASILGQEIFDKDNQLIFKGLSVRMGIHWGQPVCENDPVTRRMDYFGPMVNRASRISGVADGGQITVSSDFISEIQRCLETYSESDRNGSTGSEDAFDNDLMTQAIRRELRSLSSQGFEVKDVGECKLKGLENPEYIYLMYPHSLSGRIQFQEAKGEMATITEGNEPAVLSEQTQLTINTEMAWSLWHVSLRLEMLCSNLEETGNKGTDFVALQPPETALLEKMKANGGELTDQFLFNFLTHQVSRIETCITSLQVRQLAMGQDSISSLDQLRAPMGDLVDGLAAQLMELRRYQERFGPMSPSDDGSSSPMTTPLRLTYRTSIR